MAAMRKSIPWIDFLLYGGLALLAMGSMVVILIVGTETPGYIAAGVTTAAFVFVAVMVFSRWWRSRPDFWVDPGLAVWCSEVKPTVSTMAAVVNYYVQTLPLILKDRDMAERYAEVTPAALKGMLRGARVEWTSKPITLIGRFWSVRDKAGLQQGKGVMVHWQGSVCDSALFHELHHMVDEIILKRGPDYKHEDKEWWNLVPELKQRARIRLL